MVALCIAGATTFWFFNALNKDYATRLNYPVEFVYDNREDFVVVEELPEKVSVVVTGGGWSLLRKTFWFNKQPIKILLQEDPSNLKFLTKASLQSIISDSDQLSDVRINYVVTDTLHLNIEKRESKKVALAIDSAGISLEKNYRIVSPVVVEPDSAVVIANSSFIRSLADSLLLPVPYKQLNSSFDEVIDLSEMESDRISIEPDQIRIRFDVARFSRTTRLASIRPVNFPADSSVYLADSTAVVSFTVRDENLNEAQSAGFRLIADYRRLNPRDSTVTLTIGEVPYFVSDVEIESETVPLRYAGRRNPR